MSRTDRRGLHWALLKFAYDQGSSVNMGYTDTRGIMLSVPNVEGAFAQGGTWAEALAAMRDNLIAAGHDLPDYYKETHV